MQGGSSVRAKGSRSSMGKQFGSTVSSSLSELKFNSVQHQSTSSGMKRKKEDFGDAEYQGAANLDYLPV